MKKMLMALLMALLCMTGALALADGYTRGDKVEDFTATLSDGSTFTLSEVLKEKKAVLLNFWASWCSPCKLEMPAMNQAYDQISDEVAFICLSIEDTDTNDTIASLRDSLGLDVLPMGLDSDDLYEKFDNPDGGIPFTVVIDKNGVICFTECGSIPDTSKFISLMNIFAAEDYEEPQMVYDIPSMAPNVEAPSEEAMHSAIGAEGMEISGADDGTVWPFVISEDGTYAYASNTEVKDSLAAFMVTLDAKAGEGIAFEYAVDFMPAYGAFCVSIDGENVCEIMAGQKEWTENAVTFDEDGTHTVSFFFMRDTVLDGEMLAAIRNVRKAFAEEIQAIYDAEDKGVKTLEGETAEIEVLEGEFKDALIDTGDGSTMPMPILQDGGSVKLRIRVGQDIDIKHAYIADGSANIMLSELEHDDQGYLYTPNITVDDSGIDFSSIVGAYIAVYPSVMTASEKMPLTTLNFQTSEETMDAFVDFMNDLFGAELGEEVGLTWAYADGTPKKADVQEEKPSTMNADGTANYTVMVTDKEGRGLEKAMVQVCTNELCQVYFTDADGMVQFTDAPYAYEIHILKVPDGYERPVQVYQMAKEGGSLIIALNAAQ